MKNLITKRFLAYGIDYLLIVAYIIVLAGTSVFIVGVERIELLMGGKEFSPVKAQLFGFITLTLPVFLYFYFTEKSKRKATVGKRLMKLSVSNQLQNNNQKILTRNVLKFLPWEIAHTGVHWASYYSMENLEPPVWVWLLHLLPIFIVIAYVVSVIFYRGESSLYDKVANTKIVYVT